jgi:hypothetical protein
VLLFSLFLLPLSLVEDPLPLRRAKINQGAAVRANERATAAAEAAKKDAGNQTVQVDSRKSVTVCDCFCFEH